MPKPSGQKSDRAHPSPRFKAELRDLAVAATNDELETWVRDVRPIVRRIARDELERRGLRTTPDTLAV